MRSGHEVNFGSKKPMRLNMLTGACHFFDHLSMGIGNRQKNLIFWDQEKGIAFYMLKNKDDKVIISRFGLGRTRRGLQRKDLHQRTNPEGAVRAAEPDPRCSN
jgi:hypothetical protein